MLKKLFYFIKEQKVKIIFSTMLYFIFSLLNILSPILTKYFIDIVISTSSMTSLKYFIVIYVILIILLVLTGLVSNYVAIKALQEVKFNIKYKLYKKMYTVDHDFLNNKHAGEISYRILNDTNSVEQLLNLILISFPLDIITIVALGTVSIAWDWKLSIFVFVIILAQVFIINKFKSKAIEYSSIQQKSNQHITGVITETISDIEFIKGINMENAINTKIYQKMNYLKYINIKLTRLLATSSIVSIAISNIWTLIVLWYGGYMVINKSMSIGELMAFFMIFNMIYPKISSISNNIIKFQTLKVNFDRVMEYYDLKEVAKGGCIENFEFNTGKISINNLDFKYTESNTIFQNLNIEFNSNSVTSIVGPNGSGKTTLCKLIANIITPDKGEVLIDGIDLTKINLEYLRENIMYQSQDKFLINGTILENIVCNKDIDYKKINIILEKVGLLDFVNNLPNKLDTEVLNNNNILSLGQAQKIAIARIYYNAPKIIILDEPTSFSDRFGIEQFNTVIHEMKENATIIVVAHNKETINESDYIVNL